MCVRVCVCEPEENQSVLSRLYRMSQHGVYSAVKVDWVFSALSPRWAGLWLPRQDLITAFIYWSVEVC